MDTELAKQFFLSAHSKHEHARRWRLLGLLFHALIFWRYVAAKFGQRTAEQRIGVLTERSSELETLNSKLAALSEDVSKQVDSALSIELSEIRADFEDFNRVIGRVRDPAAAAWSVEELGRCLSSDPSGDPSGYPSGELRLEGERAEWRGEVEGRPDIRQIPSRGREEARLNVAQQPVLERSAVRGRLQLVAAVLAAIRAAPPEHWNDVLGPIVEARIVTPRFEALRVECGKLEKQFAKQSAALATLGKPFEFLAADLDFVAARWPLILGLLLAGASLWRGLADHEFLVASALAAANGSNSVASNLAQWTLRGARPASALALVALGVAALAGAQAWRVFHTQRGSKALLAR
jgi:hypothetical protein